MQLVGGVEGVAVAVEGVGVLHDELARAQHPGARPRLVAPLGLEVVQQLRELPVRAHVARDVEGQVLLVRQGQHELGAAAVLQLEHLVDVVAAAGPPELGRLEHGHQHLRRADGIHLLADDLLHPAVRAPAGGQPCPEPGGHLAGQPRSHHQLVRYGLGVRRDLLHRGQEIAREAGHAGESIWAPSATATAAGSSRGPPPGAARCPPSPGPSRAAERQRRRGRRRGGPTGPCVISGGFTRTSSFDPHTP